MAIFERIVTVYNDKGSKAALKDLNKLETNFKNAGKKIAKAFGVATVAAGALAVKIGKDGIQAAIQAQAEQNRLEQILLNTNGASREQIKVLVDQAKALEQIGVVSAGNVSVVQSQLATFDLQASTIERLTPAILDYVTAEKGATAASGDFKAMTNGLAQALNGNFASLTATGFVLDENTKNLIKNGSEQERSAALLDVLNSTYRDFNENLRNTPEGKIQALRNSFDGLLTTVGFALLPVFEDLVRMFQDELLPAFESFVENNKEQIAATFKNVAKFAVSAGKGLASMFSVISKNLPAFKLFTALLVATFVGAKVYAGVKLLIGAIGLLTLAFKKQAVAGTAAGVATAFATAGVSAKAAAIGIAAFVVAAGGALHALNELTKGFGKTTTAISKQSQVVQGHMKDLQEIARLTRQATTGGVGGGVGGETSDIQDAINLEAGRLNLIREGRIEEAERIADRQKEKESIKATIAEAQKYQDILQAISDTKITNEEIALLAAKWGMTTDAVKNYLAQFFAVVDKKIDKTEIDILAAAWGLTTDQVEKYLDFVNALKDSKLSPEEIAALQDKWGMTVGEIEKYRDFVLALRDFTVTDKEVAALGNAWGLSNTEVLAYLASIGIPFDYNGTFIDPVKGIGTAWTDTKGAVDAYIASVGDAGTALDSLASNATTNAGIAQTAIEGANGALLTFGTTSKDSTKSLTDGVNAADTALANLATNATTNAAIAEAALDSATGAAGELAEAAQGAIAIGEMAMAVAEGARATAALAEAEAMSAQSAAGAALAAAQAASAAAQAASSAAGSFTGLGIAIDPSSFGSNTVTGGIGNGEYESGVFGPGAGQGTTVNVTVQGSVISQDDLISTVRDGLLVGIGSGQETTYDPRRIR